MPQGTGRRKGAVVTAVERDLKALGPDAKGSTLAATALALARELDQPGNSATSKSMCAKSMVEVMREVRALAPAKREADRLDELNARRQARRQSTRTRRAATP